MVGVTVNPGDEVATEDRHTYTATVMVLQTKCLLVLSQTMIKHIMINILNVFISALNMKIRVN